MVKVYEYFKVPDPTLLCGMAISISASQWKQVREPNPLNPCQPCLLKVSAILGVENGISLSLSLLISNSLMVKLKLKKKNNTQDSLYLFCGLFADIL